MKFAHPFFLILLLVPFAAALWEWRRRGRVVNFPFDLVCMPSGQRTDRMIRLANCLPLAMVSMAILLLAEPQRQLQGEVERDVRNVNLLIDSSGSMTDPFGPSGIRKHDAAINAIDAFIRHRKGDAFGLTLYGGDVLNWIPLTKDSTAILQSRAFLDPDRLPQAMAGTGTGMALTYVSNQLAMTHTGDRTVILVTDGDAGDLQGEAADRVTNKLIDTKVVLYTVIINIKGVSPVATKMSEATGGAAFMAGDQAALEQVFSHIDKMTPAHFKPVSRARIDWLGPVILAAAVFTSLHLMSSFKLRYTPW